MRRTGFDERRDQQIADEYTGSYAACGFCGCQTERTTLIEYGARCGPCFTQYVTGGKPNPPMPSIERRKEALSRLRAVLTQTQHPKLWAYRLKRLEEAGEPLSRTQRESWRAALREPEQEAA